MLRRSCCPAGSASRHLRSMRSAGWRMTPSTAREESWRPSRCSASGWTAPITDARYPTPSIAPSPRRLRAFDMPRELPEALLSGLEWDARGRRYDDLE